MVGPDYTPPEPGVPDAWNAAILEEFDGEEPTLATWWQVFNDETLNLLVAKAAEGNLDLKIASSRITEFRAQLGFAKGELLPQLDADGAALWTRTSEETTPFLPESLEREDNLFLMGASVGWELDLWGRIRRSVESAGAGYEASIENYRDVLVLLYADLASAYFNMRSLQERIRLAENNARLQEETLQLTRDRNAAGLVSELDVRQAERQLATTRAEIPTLRARLVRAMNRLGILTGQGPSALHETLEMPKDFATPPENITVGIPVDLLRQRPDVRRSERLLASQHARIGFTKGALYPTFTLPGTFAFEALDVDGLFESGNLAYTFGPSVRWNLFSGGRIRNAVRIEEARTQQALHEYESTVLLALEDVENAMVALAEERNRNEHLSEAVQAALKSAELVDKLYRSGLTDFQNVLDNQRELTIQQDALAASDGLLSINFAQLYKALGGGWSTTDARNE